MRKPYTKEEIRKVLCEHNLEILSEIKTAQDKVHCKTKEGYDVTVIPQGIIARNDRPLIFSKHNPYTLNNIALWLKQNNVPLEIVSDKYLGAATKMEWKCLLCGDTFSTTWDIVHGGKKCCNFCAKSRRYDGKINYLQIISDECEKFDYTLLTNNIPRSNSRFYYICNKHKDKGVLHSTYDSMINGNAHCKYCGFESLAIKHRLRQEDICELVQSKGFIYKGIIYTEGKTPGKTKVGIICPHHRSKGVQYLSIDNLRCSNGRCAYCAGRNRSKEDIQNECDELGLNVLIVEYEKYADPILVKCKMCGNEWYTSGVNLTQGHSCPNCTKSHFESEVETILKKLNFKYISQYRFNDCRDINPLPFDFYIKDINTLIEVDGEGHYMPIRRSSSMSDEDASKQLEVIQKHDSIKTGYCQKQGIKLIRIPYWERKNIENYLKEKIIT